MWISQCEGRTLKDEGKVRTAVWAEALAGAKVRVSVRVCVGTEKRRGLKEGGEILRGREGWRERDMASDSCKWEENMVAGWL